MNITNDTKTNISIANEPKGLQLTWDEATFAWNSDQAQVDTWDQQGKLIVYKESKNAVTITNDAKI